MCLLRILRSCSLSFDALFNAPSLGPTHTDKIGSLYTFLRSVPRAAYCAVRCATRLCLHGHDSRAPGTRRTC